MPKRAVVATLLTTAALALLLSFKTPYVAPSPVSNAGGGNGGNAAGGGNGGNAAGGSAAIRSTYSGQLTGNAVNTPYGTVQVQLTIQNGVITDATALHLPSGGGHTGQISSYAGPQLRSEVLVAQSAQIDTISGATYTSEGYIQSLQSALDQIPA
ncbi:MAG TPA: FMN-binding protein [Candidatus Limnocylindrales bacterium]